jgi:transcriptional regulator with XRE-family HTH domain
MSKKTSWDKRYEKIKSMYPSIDGVDWSNAIEHDEVFIKMLGDVLKSERKVSTPGKRPSLTKTDGLERLNKILDRDYSSAEFDKAFKILASGRSVRSLNAKTGLSKSHIQRLLTGQDSPSIEVIEKIATAFNKHPSYFLEYRIYIVLDGFNSLMIKNPETATSWYKKIIGG